MNVWETNANGGKQGYIQIAEFKFTGNYANKLILLTVSGRGIQSEHVKMLFTNMGKPEDTEILNFGQSGSNFLFLYKDKESNIFKLYAKKSEVYDYISVTEFQRSDYMKQEIKWTWTNIFTDTLPEGAVRPIPYSMTAE